MERNEVAAAIREDLITGAVAPGAWVREEYWAAKLAVSRTPVREALVGLHRDGLLLSVPRRGFRCPELKRKELEDLYAMLMAIEALAIRSAAFEPQGVVAELTELNRELREQTAPRRNVVIDARWHGALVAAGANSIAAEVHRQMLDRVARYEYAYWGREEHQRVSYGEHDRIIEALSTNDRRLSSALIEAHWTGAARRLGPLLEAAREDQSV